MSSQIRPSGIPFPHTSEQGTSTPTKPRRGVQRTTMGEETFATPEVPVRRGARPSSRDGANEEGINGTPGRRGHKTSNSSSSSGSTAGTEGLPSIRNLLSSIDSDDRAASPSSLSRRQHSLSSQTSDAQVANRLPGFGHGGRGPFRSSEQQQQASSHWRNSQSWDLKASMRPSSPTRRPPLAPSAYAHAHFSPSGSRASLFGSGPTRDDDAQHVKNSRLRTSRVSMHVQDYGRAQPPMSDALAAERIHESGDPRSVAPETDEEGRAQESGREPASVRRRHTLGALDEPPRLRADGAEVTLAEDKDMATTPRAPYHHKLLSPIHRIPESPTTPTASNIASRTPQSEMQRQHHARSGSDVALPPHAHPMYMQNSMHASGSMPSLVSQAASPVKLGARKSSFEDGREGGPAYPGHGPYNGSETLTSPHSSVWHSRSSTLDSIDTASSLGSLRSSSSMVAPRGAHMHSHHHSLSSSSVGSMSMRRPPVEEFPRTPTHARHDYNRNWRFPTNQGTPREGMPLQGRVPGEGGTPTGPGVHASPFANMSLSSPSDPRTNAPPPYPRHQPYDSPVHRPRAQTLSYNDRPIAPLPSHSVHGAPHQSPVYHAPARSLSSHSVSSLPHRVSTMQLESWGPGGAAMDYQTAANLANQSPTGTVIVSAKTSAGSGSSSNKYTCTWCGKRFSRPSSLKIHYHSHTGEKPYTCDEPGCGRNFSVQSNLRRHQKSHATFSERLGSNEGDLRRTGSLHSRNASDASHSTASFGSQRRHSGTLGQPWGSPISSARDRAAFLAAQNRRPSISSSTAGEEEEEEYELEEEEAARSLGSLKSRRFEYASEDEGAAPARFESRREGHSHIEDGDETMQDVRHERASPSSPSSASGAMRGSVPAYTTPAAPVSRFTTLASSRG